MRRRLHALSACSGVVHLERVHVRVIVLVVDLVCLMLVLSALVVLLAVLIQCSSPVFCSKRYTLYRLFFAQKRKLSIHYCADPGTIETVFSHSCLCKSAQSLRSSPTDVGRIRNLS